MTDTKRSRVNEHMALGSYEGFGYVPGSYSPRPDIVAGATAITTPGKTAWVCVDAAAPLWVPASAGILASAVVNTSGEIEAYTGGIEIAAYTPLSGVYDFTLTADVLAGPTMIFAMTRGSASMPTLWRGDMTGSSTFSVYGTSLGGGYTEDVPFYVVVVGAFAFAGA